MTLLKIRNPKLEIRNKSEGPKSESQNQAASRRFEAWSFFGFWISGFGFVERQIPGGPMLEFRPEVAFCFCTDPKSLLESPTRC